MGSLASVLPELSEIIAPFGGEDWGGVEEDIVFYSLNNPRVANASIRSLSTYYSYCFARVIGDY